MIKKSIEAKARELYEADVKAKPLYHNGQPRRDWEDLPDIAKWSWGRAYEVS